MAAPVIAAPPTTPPTTPPAIAPAPAPEDFDVLESFGLEVVVGDCEGVDVGTDSVEDEVGPKPALQELIFVDEMSARNESLIVVIFCVRVIESSLSSQYSALV